jgi:site-specific DNA recombinase
VSCRFPRNDARYMTIAARHGRTISREYVEAGCSGTSANRKAFREMLEDVFRPGSDVGTVVVHHMSRFTRNATEARVVKEKLRKEGVRVVAVCQETNDDPIGKLIEGVFECIDQYESEVNGMRTSAAMREAVRQGYFPGSGAPFGFSSKKVEIRPNVLRSVLIRDEKEAAIVRQLFHLYVAGNGAKSVAQALNERGLLYRRGKAWSKDLVLHVLDEPAVAGTYYWGQWSAKRKNWRNESEWLPLRVEPLVESSLYELAMKLRMDREPIRNPGRPASRWPSSIPQYSSTSRLSSARTSDATRSCAR